jgi:hypothetical protein
MPRWQIRTVPSRARSRLSTGNTAARSNQHRKKSATGLPKGQSIVRGPRPQPRTDEQLLRIAVALTTSFDELRHPLTWPTIKLVCKRLEIDLRCVPIGSPAWLVTFAGYWAIRINKDRSRSEKLRLAAHDFAHFVLHRNHLVRVRLRDMRACELHAWCDVEEDEADRFAAILLSGVGLAAG